MTDWTTTNVQIQGECTAAGCMRAGNSGYLSCREIKEVKNILWGYTKSRV